MKVIPGLLADHQALETNTLAECLFIKRTDDVIFGFTSHDENVVIDGQLYDAAQGLDITQLVTSASTTVDNMEITTLDDGSLFKRIDILAGRWQNASFQIFRYNFRSPADGIDILISGVFGQITPKATTLTIELRGLQQYLQQPVGDTSTKTCRAIFGDSRCKFDTSSVTVDGTITGVVNSQVFQDTARTEMLDWYSNGVLTWLTGASEGLSQKVKQYDAGGTITLALPMTQEVLVGDTYRMVAGCLKRVDEDCIGKYSNVLNFVGEPHRPGIDLLTAAPETTAGV